MKLTQGQLAEALQRHLVGQTESPIQKEWIKGYQDETEEKQTYYLKGRAAAKEDKEKGRGAWMDTIQTSLWLAYDGHYDYVIQAHKITWAPIRAWQLRHEEDFLYWIQHGKTPNKWTITEPCPQQETICDFITDYGHIYGKDGKPLPFEKQKDMYIERLEFWTRESMER